MASWLTHLRTAERIKQRVSGIDFPYFLIGSIAPDSSMSDDALVDMDQYAFFDNYLIPEKIMTRSDSTRSFLWGYYFHLITDSLWLEECFRPFKIRYEIDFEKPDKDFTDFIREEMFAVDFEYLKEKGTSLIEQLKGFNGDIGFFYESDAEHIYRFKDRIADFYFGEPLKLNREYKYLTPETIEGFVAKASDKCINILVA